MNFINNNGGLFIFLICLIPVAITVMVMIPLLARDTIKLLTKDFKQKKG